MKLYINKDIAADANKMRYWLTGQDAVSYNDISAYLDYMRDYYPEDNRIDVEIHSCGGDCTEGYAIYDALRASGREISCTVVGQCASMATVILLAAPKENRTMYQHAEMLIHEPYYPELQGSMTIAKLEAVKADLQKEKEKMLAVYEERTGVAREVLEGQIVSGTWFGADKAIELGFVSSVVPVASAHEVPQHISTTIQHEEMKINESSAIGKAFATIAKALGVAAEDEVAEPVGMVVTDVNGNEINIEREEGDPQVGDKTDAADGEYTLPDGRTLVVQDGTITEIKESEGEGNSEDEETDKEDEEKKALEARVAELEAKLSEAMANGKTEDENNVLGMVAKAGGLDWLKRQTGNYKPAGRANEDKPDANAGGLKSAIEEARKKQAEFVPYWKK